MKRAAFVFLLLTACHGSKVETTTRSSHDDARVLRPVSAFADISDDEERAQALFLEASKVIMHPRCTNCHPADDSPRQHDDHRLHDPAVVRGPNDRGVPGMECSTCHQDTNVQLARVPGAPNWHLAPIEMAWLGKSVHEICEQVKTPARNGGKSLAEIVDHSRHDELVSWGWKPGSDREAAPGTQAEFGDLMEAWASAGAACPGGGS